MGEIDKALRLVLIGICFSNIFFSFSLMSHNQRINQTSKELQDIKVQEASQPASQPALQPVKEI